MLDAGAITPESFSWLLPTVIATKKDGKPRFCVEYRGINTKKKGDRGPIPKIEEILDDLCASEYFTTLELPSGYWQARMSERCVEKTKFVCREGMCQSKVMPFSLMNVPLAFQGMMEDVLKGVDCTRVYLEDMIVFSRTFEEHLVHLQVVIKRVAK